MSALSQHLMWLCKFLTDLDLSHLKRCKFAESWLHLLWAIMECFSTQESCITLSKGCVNRGTVMVGPSQDCRSLQLPKVVVLCNFLRKQTDDKKRSLIKHSNVPPFGGGGGGGRGGVIWMFEWELHRINCYFSQNYVLYLQGGAFYCF